MSQKGRCSAMYVRRDSHLRFIGRFSVIHTLTYAVFGILFMLISDYFTHFAQDELLSQVIKPADALTVRLAIPVQFLRGAILGSAVYPFRESLFKDGFSWLRLSWLIIALTLIGAVITGPGSIEGFLYTNFKFTPLIGSPEVIIQAIVFSILFTWWTRRKNR